MSINIQRYIDKYAGYGVMCLLLLLKPIKIFIKPKSKKVALIRLWTLGESLNTLPVIKELKKQKYSVDVVVRNRSKPVFQNYEFVDNIIDFSPKLLLKLWQYDFTIDTEPHFNISAILSFWMGKKSIGFSNMFRRIMYDYKIKYNDKQHSVLNMMKLASPLKIKTIPKHLEPLKFSEKDRKNMDKILKNKKQLIGMHLGTAETSKWRMWKIQNFKELIKKINKEYPNMTIILTGSKKEDITNKEIIKELKLKNIMNIAGTSIPELSYLMTKFKVFISNDTGPMHLSAAMGTRTIGLFGPNLPERFGPFNEKSIAIYKARKLKCSPCINVHKGEFRKCPYNGKCMDLIKVNDVYSEIKKILK